MANGTILYRQGRNVSGGGSRIHREVWVADFARVVKGKGLFQADAEGALLGG